MEDPNNDYSTTTPASPYENSPNCFVDEYDEIDDFNELNHHDPSNLPVITAFSFSPKIQKPSLILDQPSLKKEDDARIMMTMGDQEEQLSLDHHDSNKDTACSERNFKEILTVNVSSAIEENMIPLLLDASITKSTNQVNAHQDSWNQKLKYHDFLIVELGEDYGFMKMALPRERYEPVYENVRTGKIQVLGKGAFGIVIACHDKQNNNAKVAVKKCINALNVVPWNIIREIECMKHLRGHRNIIELIDVYIEYNSFDKESSDIYIVTELCEKTLWEYLNEKTFPQTPLYEYEVKNFMSQLLSCCVYMHSASILHRDIKPENLLMKGEILKLIDFGSATMCREQQQVEHLESVYVVTKCYRPPEVVLTSEEQSPAIDLWSIGCVFAELLFLLEDPPSRQPLFYVKNPGVVGTREHLMKIVAICGKPSTQDMLGSLKGKEYFQTLLNKTNQPKIPLDAIFANASPEALDLLSKLLTFNPAKRITPEAALRHPYLKGNRYIDTNNCDEEFQIKLLLDDVTIVDRKESDRWKLPQWKKCFKELLVDWGNELASNPINKTE
ncbi:hypothetical protein C9374_000944 [Naegleria lovaniensis]|uniref:Protein kinase domain-containing protein n=1 Tax=Naegleria lovaniensis TaxID=51637 RepID=A0AA88GXT4_NAELO|nr:uncharacterized protein C9374_000944 [Naegleria lovaniensis]KAG2388094.1 hypothetical protein C9374_000944 [Naegleria lovaniensis]